jgi:hypothetical protein
LENQEQWLENELNLQQRQHAKEYESYRQHQEAYLKRIVNEMELKLTKISGTMDSMRSSMRWKRVEEVDSMRSKMDSMRSKRVEEVKEINRLKMDSMRSNHIEEVKEINSKHKAAMRGALLVDSIKINHCGDNSLPPSSTESNKNKSQRPEKIGLNTKEVDKVKRTMEEITAYMKKALIKFGFTSEATEELVKSSFVQVGPGDPTLLTVSSFGVPGEEARADTNNPCSQFQTQLLAGRISFIRLDIWQMINFSCSGDMGKKNSLKNILKRKGSS